MKGKHKNQTTNNSDEPIDLLSPSLGIHPRSCKNPNQTQQKKNKPYSIGVKIANPWIVLTQTRNQ